MSNAQIKLIISRAFPGARMTANACGGSSSYRKTTLKLSNALYREEWLPRLHYKYTDRESDLVGAYPKAMRACVNHWNTTAWSGDISEGKIRVRIPWYSSFIKTRQGYYHRGGWHWSGEGKDSILNDYAFPQLYAYVYLTLQTNGNGGLTYGGVSARWAHTNGTWHPSAPPFNPALETLPQLQQKIVNYSDHAMEIIRRRIEAAFRDPNVRNRLSEEITQNVTNSGRRKVKSVKGTGSTITVTYEG